MKKFSLIYILLSSIVLVGCDFTSSNALPQSRNQSKAQNWFIENSQYMSEREALSKEFSYYQNPSIVYSRYLGKLDGRGLIHIANEQIKINEAELESLRQGQTWAAFTINVSDIKELGLSHPNDLVAELFVFGGDFVNFKPGITRIYKLIIYIPELDRFFELKQGFLNSVTIYNGPQLEEWLSALPIYEDYPLQ